MFLQFLRLDGKAFHTVGPAWKKARSPKVFRVTLGITSNVSESDRTLYLVLGFTIGRLFQRTALEKLFFLTFVWGLRNSEFPVGVS